MSWGYNGYGELGLGDINVRSQPTRSNPFAKATRLTDLSCGDRHTVVITTHIPIVARQDPNLRQYYEVLEETNYNPSIYKQLKKLMQRKGLDSDLLDSPNAPIANQAGVTDAVLTIDLYERGTHLLTHSYSLLLTHSLRASLLPRHQARSRRLAP
jgi:hypothetical protein